VPPSQSITNILQALYESSSTVKMYVDAISSGRPVPYTILTKSSDNEENEAIVKRLYAAIDTIHDGNTKDILREIADEAMILEEELYTVVMFKGDAVVDGSEQIVKGTKVEELKDYARFKGFTIPIKKRQ